LKILVGNKRYLIFEFEKNYNIKLEKIMARRNNNSLRSMLDEIPSNSANFDPNSLFAVPNPPRGQRQAPAGGRLRTVAFNPGNFLAQF
jgi:hypothetical protein